MNSGQEENLKGDIMTLGMLLRSERERVGLSLEKAAGILMVRKIHLINLENDVYDNFPAGVYFRGFLRNYARLLGLDENKVFEYYECQLEITREEKIMNNIKKPEKKKEKVGKFNLIITPDILLKVFSVLVVIVGAYLFVKALSGVSKVPKLVIESPKDNETVQIENIEIIGHTDTNSILLINNENITLRENGSFKTDVVLMEGVNEINIEVENKSGRILKEKLYVNYEPIDEQEEEFQKKLIIKTDTEPVEFTVIKNEESETVELKKNSEKEIIIDKMTIIKTGDANNLYYIEKESANDEDILKLFSEEETEMEKIFYP